MSSGCISEEGICKRIEKLFKMSSVWMQCVLSSGFKNQVWSYSMSSLQKRELLVSEEIWRTIVLSHLLSYMSPGFYSISLEVYVNKSTFVSGLFLSKERFFFYFSTLFTFWFSVFCSLVTWKPWTKDRKKYQGNLIGKQASNAQSSPR